MSRGLALVISLAGEPDSAATLGDQAGYRMQSRAFAGAVAAEQRDEFALPDSQADAVHHLSLAIGDVQILDFEECAHAPRYTRMTSGS